MRTERGESALRASIDSNMVDIEGGGTSNYAAAVMRDALLCRRWYICLLNSTISYAYVATGRLAGVINFGIPSTNAYGSVHTAAGCLVAAEAGAIVTDLDTRGEWTVRTQSLMIAAT